MLLAISHCSVNFLNVVKQPSSVPEKAVVRRMINHTLSSLIAEAQTKSTCVGCIIDITRL